MKLKKGKIGEGEETAKHIKTKYVEIQVKEDLQGRWGRREI